MLSLARGITVLPGEIVDRMGIIFVGECLPCALDTQHAGEGEFLADIPTCNDRSNSGCFAISCSCDSVED